MPEADGIFQLANLNPTGEAPTWHFVPIYVSPSRYEDAAWEKVLIQRRDVRSQRIHRPWTRTTISLAQALQQRRRRYDQALLFMVRHICGIRASYFWIYPASSSRRPGAGPISGCRSGRRQSHRKISKRDLRAVVGTESGSRPAQHGGATGYWIVEGRPADAGSLHQQDCTTHSQQNVRLRHDSIEEKGGVWRVVRDTFGPDHPPRALRQPAYWKSHQAPR